MNDRADPTVQRLALRLQLRKLRIESGLDQKQVAQALAWSPTKLLRIESGEVGVGSHDLQALLGHYRVTDDRRVEELHRLARDGARDAPGSYDDVLNKELRTLLRYERAASVIRQFEPIFVPGLLQTQEYADVVLTMFASPEDSATDVRRRVEARISRQTLLEREDMPEMFFILDESVLRRWVGSESGGDDMIMRRQVEHLKRIGSKPRVTIQILPYRSGVHQGLKGPFVIIEFADPSAGEVLYLEDPKGDYIAREDPMDLRSYLERFWELESLATPRGALDGFLDDVLRDMDINSGP